MSDTVLHGDCLTLLKTLPDNSVDSIVTDPPAGIEFMGKEWDSFKQGRLKNYKSQPGGKIGSNPGEGADFSARLGALPNTHQKANPKCLKCNKYKWDWPDRKCVCELPDWKIDNSARETFIAFLREVMTEALRVLKPGGHALIWALPRTSHWTATALEDAGWEIRDCCYHIAGSGFPKSLDISKAIDKHLGKKRETVGYGLHAARRHSQPFGQGATQDESIDTRAITVPATPEAAEWQGWGSALKPAVECWWLCRKPLAESSIAAQVLATGTGGLNIDQCRVGLNGEKQPTGSGDRRNSSTYAQDEYTRNHMHNGGNTTPTQGRFPSHLLLSHSLWCVPRGTKRVRGDHKRGQLATASGANPGMFGLGVQGQSHDRYADSEGYEQVEAYDCAPDCPIAELDRQSGVRKSGGPGIHKAGKQGYHGNAHDFYTEGHASEGFASRYFTNFPPDDYTPYRYISKASRAERNAGCEDLPEVSNQEHEGRTGQNNSSTRPDGSQRQPIMHGNGHPTVKPLALMRWLIRLITPPDGIVLDPFCGSGSTCVAAIQEGKHFIGIEQDSSYCDIANARIEYARTHEPDVVQVATKKVKGHASGYNWEPPNNDNPSHVTKNIKSGVHYGDEEVEDWECAPDCPVRILGEQSGERKSAYPGNPEKAAQQSHKHYEDIPTKIYGDGLSQRVGRMTSDTGTAARYFQTFPPDSLWCDDAEEVGA